MLVVTVATAAAAVVVRGAVFGAEVVVFRLPLKGRRVVPGGRRVMKAEVV